MVDISQLFDPGAAFQGQAATQTITPTQSLIASQGASSAAPQAGGGTQTLGQRLGVPQWDTDWKGALGTVLGEFAAGFAGRPGSFIKSLADQKNKAEEMKLRRMTLGFNAFKQTLEIAKALPADQRNEFLRKSGANLSSVLGPGASQFFSQFANVDFTTLPSDIKMITGAERNGKKGVLMWNTAKNKEEGFIPLAAIKGDLPFKVKTEKNGKVMVVGLDPRSGKKLFETEVGQIKTPQSATLDARGAVKPDVEQKILTAANRLFPNSINEKTGEIQATSPEDAKKAQKLAQRAVKILEEKRATSFTEALNKAAEELDLPVKVKEPEAKVPKKQREQLTAQNNDINSILALSGRLKDVERATGLVSRGKTFLEGLSQGAFGTLFPDTAKARQEFRQFNQAVKTAIVNNPRYPVAEQNLVSSLLVDPDEWFTNPKVALQKHQQLMGFLRDKVKNNTDLLEGRQPGGGGGDLPKGIPEGSKPAGTSKRGNPVWRTRDGKLLEVTPE